MQILLWVSCNCYNKKPSILLTHHVAVHVYDKNALVIAYCIVHRIALWKAQVKVDHHEQFPSTRPLNISDDNDDLS